MAEEGKEIQKVDQGETGIAEYGEFSPEALRDEEEFTDKAEASDWLEKPEGDTAVRFMPPPVGEGLPWIVIYEHSIKLPGMNFPVRFPCPKLMARKPCSYCAKSEALKKSGNKADKDLGFELSAKRQCYADVIDRSKQEHGPFIFSFGKKIHEPLKGILSNPKKGGNFFHPVNGRDIILNREGKGQFDTVYTVTASMETSPFAPDPETMKRWLAMRHDFSSFVVPKSDEENCRAVEEAAERQARQGGGGSRGGSPGGRGAPRPRTAAGDIENPFDPGAAR